MLLAWVVREMKENSVQGVNRSSTQQLAYLCKQFLVYPFNYHFRVFSSQACSYPFPEPSSQEREGGTEGSKKGSLLPLTRVLPLWWAKCWMDSVCGSAGGGLSEGIDKQCCVHPPLPPLFFLQGNYCLYLWSKMLVRSTQYFEVCSLHCISESECVRQRCLQKVRVF